MKKRKPKPKTIRKQYWMWVENPDQFLLVSPGCGAPCVFSHIERARGYCRDVPGRPMRVVLEWEVES